MAALYSHLLSDIELHDYHFLVAPIDHHHITRDGFPQLAQLEKDFPYSDIRVYFNPITGEMTVSTMSSALRAELQYLLLSKMRAGVAAQPLIANPLEVCAGLEPLGWDSLDSELPNVLIALSRSDCIDEAPSLIVNCSLVAGNRDKKHEKISKSAPTHIMTRYPGIHTMVCLDLGGLTKGKFINREHFERRIQRIADVSSVVTWIRDRQGKIVGTTENLSKEDGELYLPLLGQDVGVAVKYSEILDAIRLAGRRVPFAGVSQNGHRALESSVVPFASFHHHILGSSFNMGIAGHAARLLGLGHMNTTTGAALGGRDGARVFRPLPYALNRARAVVAPVSRLLARLPRKW
ncbi:hypothetical protein C8A03DRAFT_34118 [Achaetomium macrosporum]|uniref:Uncharacterized protein n=1 Tax=Achaetomium macrosporum TaxID=79813 RepID=A0AAN7HF56_9PEZI|nr:hypothetical protein C8A03DRAFT_34118 [Achaetomium macrosporum]